MFGKNHTDDFIHHLQQEVAALRGEVAALEAALQRKDAAHAEERRDLLNRILGLPPQSGQATAETEGLGPIPYESRTTRMLKEQRERQEKEHRDFLAAQGEREKSLAEFRAQAQAAAAGDE